MREMKAKAARVDRLILTQLILRHLKRKKNRCLVYPHDAADPEGASSCIARLFKVLDDRQRPAFRLYMNEGILWFLDDPAYRAAPLDT